MPSRAIRRSRTCIPTSRRDDSKHHASTMMMAMHRRQGRRHLWAKCMSQISICAIIENIKSFDDRLSAIIGKGTKIDVLVNNAGVMAIPTKQLTRDGHERTFQTNHLGHFVLTSLLLPRWLRSNARVINVSSMAYQIRRSRRWIGNR